MLRVPIYSNTRLQPQPLLWIIISISKGVATSKFEKFGRITKQPV